MTLLIAAACAAVAVAGVVLTVVRAVPDSDDGGPPFSGPVIIGAACPLAALAVARMAAIHEDRPPAGETALAVLPPAQDDPGTAYPDWPTGAFERVIFGGVTV